MTAPDHDPAKPAPAKHDPATSGFWWIPGGMLITAAAAIVAWWLWPPNQEVRELSGDASAQAANEPLPAYALTTDGGLAHADADADAARQHRYRRDTPFEWRLRPEHDAEGELAVRAFAFVDGSAAGLPLASVTELADIDESGAVRIAGTIEQLELEPGRYTIALVVGRAAKLPTELRELSEPAADAGWQLRRVELEIEG